MNVLFICNQNLNRSKTAEEIFRDKFNTKSAGLFNKKPVKEQELEWADLVVVMEDFQRTEISKRFPKNYMKKQIISLNITDNYYFMEPRLIKILKEQIDQIMITIY